jgi:hypothetical protein
MAGTIFPKMELRKHRISHTWKSNKVARKGKGGERHQQAVIRE